MFICPNKQSLRAAQNDQEKEKERMSYTQKSWDQAPSVKCWAKTATKMYKQRTKNEAEKEKLGSNDERAKITFSEGVFPKNGNSKYIYSYLYDSN